MISVNWPVSSEPDTEEDEAQDDEHQQYADHNYQHWNEQNDNKLSKKSTSSMQITTINTEINKNMQRLATTWFPLIMENKIPCVFPVFSLCNFSFSCVFLH